VVPSNNELILIEYFEEACYLISAVMAMGAPLETSIPMSIWGPGLLIAVVVPFSD
jgi:hypothetical protein